MISEVCGCSSPVKESGENNFKKSNLIVTFVPFQEQNLSTHG